jgi:hypothetical protein
MQAAFFYPDRPSAQRPPLPSADLEVGGQNSSMGQG